MLILRRTCWLGTISVLTRGISALAQEKGKPAPRKSVTDAPRYVYISMSRDIYANLAVEHWLYQNSVFHNQRILFLWWNDPCVVIGRHQNPWTEVNINVLKDNKISLARRNSGGGTVYHDQGNLNLTFFAPRDLYNRKENLETICRGLRKKWNLDVSVNKRDDIVLNNLYKISGTASKLGSSSTYHHCTLLVNVNAENLHEVLMPEQIGIESKATASVPSQTKNLAEELPQLRVDEVGYAIGEEYLVNGSRDMNRGFQLINPTESWFPGLEAMRAEFASHEWVYDRTPKFQIRKIIPLPSMAQGSCGAQLHLSLTVDHGQIVEISLPSSESRLLGKKLTELADINGDIMKELQRYLAATKGSES